MSVDLSKRKGKGKGSVPVIPTKKTMNFVHHRSSFNAKKMVPIILVVVILAGIFVKFAIIDRLNEKAEASRELANKQEQLAALQLSLKDYDDIAEEYGRYSYGWMDEIEVNLVNRMDVFKLIEQKIASQCVIEDLSVDNNTLTLNLSGLTLEQGSAMVKDLESSKLVESAIIYDAVAEDAENARVFLSVNLTKEAE